MSLRLAWALGLMVAVTMANAAPAEAGGRGSIKRSMDKVTRRVRHMARKVREMPRPDRTLVTASRLRLAARTGPWKTARLPIDRLRAVHGSPTPAIERKIERRAAQLRRSRTQILATSLVDTRTLDRRAPSPSPIRVIHHRGAFYVMDGNSRLRSVRRAFPAQRGLKVEVQLLDRPSPAARRLLDSLVEQRAMR